MRQGRRAAVAEPRRGKFVRDTASVLGTEVLVTFLAIGTSVITARVLGPHDRGLFQLLVILPVTLSNFVKFGIPQANVYFMRRRNAPSSLVAANAFWLAIGLGGGLAIICYLGRDFLLSTILRQAPPATLPPVLLLLPFVLLQTFFLGIVQAQERFREYNLQQILPPTLGLVGMTIALLWLRAGLLGAIITQTVVVMIVVLALMRRVQRSTGFGFQADPALMRGMLAFGGKSYLQTLASTLHFRIGQYMIAIFLDPTQVGLYAIASHLTNLILKVPEATGTVLYPRLAAAAERNAHAQTSAACRHTFFITGLASLGCLLFGGLAIRILYGEAYAGAVVPLWLMLPGVVCLSLYLLLTRNFTSRARQEVNIAAAGMALVINVVANYLLIPRLGIAGAAIATSLSYGGATLLLLVYFVRESGHTLGQTLLVGRADLANYLRLAAWVRS
jgi:O-antigen/teichoic acid export membrane protein